MVAYPDGPVLLHSTYPVGRTVYADEVDISGGGMTSRRNSTAAQQETEKDGTQTEVGDGR